MSAAHRIYRLSSHSDGTFMSPDDWTKVTACCSMRRLFSRGCSQQDAFALTHDCVQQSEDKVRKVVELAKAKGRTTLCLCLVNPRLAACLPVTANAMQACECMQQQQPGPAAFKTHHELAQGLHSHGTACAQAQALSGELWRTCRLLTSR